MMKVQDCGVSFKLTFRIDFSCNEEIRDIREINEGSFTLSENVALYIGTCSCCLL